MLIWRYLTARTVLLRKFRPFFFTSAVVFTSFLAMSSAASAVTRVPTPCGQALAPRLCATHAHVRRVNVLRARMGQPAIRYGYWPERHPARRDAALTYWLGVHRRTTARYVAWRNRPAWLREPFYSQALCIHSKESVDWYEPGSPGGGMQFIDSTWNNYVVRGYEFAPAASMATPSEQLHAAYRLVSHDGDWHEWSTHSLCGL